MSNHGWIGVDLDGTLAHYDGWIGPDHIGKPIGPMLLRVKAWLAEGRIVKLVTARVCEKQTPQTIVTFKAAWAIWCKAAGIPVLPVTAAKDFQMAELYDDRAKQVEPNTGRLVEDSLHIAVQQIKRTVRSIRSFLPFVRQNDLPEDGQVQLMNLTDQCDRLFPIQAPSPVKEWTPIGIENIDSTDGRGVPFSIIPGGKVVTPT